MRRIFLVANTTIDFGEHQINAPACQGSLGGVSWHIVEVRCVDRYPGPGLIASIIKGSNYDPSKNIGWAHQKGVIYKITGTPSEAVSSGNCYFRTRVAVRVVYYVNGYCSVYPEYPGNPTSYPERSWYSPYYPTNEWFWFCVVSQPPKIADNLQINAVKIFPLNFEVPMVHPLTHIPERFTSSGLPPGVTLTFNDQPPALIGPDYKYIPKNYLPVLTGTPTQEGVFIANITASNPVGSTTTPVIIRVGPFPHQSLSVGNLGASAFQVGDQPVNAIYIGDSQIYPYT